MGYIPTIDYVPTRIYLQIKDEDGEWGEDVTWCVDRIYDTDVQYVRVDIVSRKESIDGTQATSEV